MDGVTDRGNDLALVEAALFLSPQPMTRRGLAKILGGVQLAYVDGLLEDLAASYQDSVRGLEVLVDEGRAYLRVKPDYIERVAHLAPQQDIPRPVLRTLAVIAYNHPMTQADLIKVRGNKGYGHVQELLERGLIRSEDHGRTLLLHVTGEFLRHFGLSTVEEFRFHVPAAEALAAEDPSEEESEAATVDPSGEDLEATSSVPAQGDAEGASPSEALSPESEDGAEELEDPAPESSRDEAEETSPSEAPSEDEDRAEEQTEVATIDPSAEDLEAPSHAPSQEGAEDASSSDAPSEGEDDAAEGPAEIPEDTAEDEGVQSDANEEDDDG